MPIFRNTLFSSLGILFAIIIFLFAQTAFAGHEEELFRLRLESFFHMQAQEALTVSVTVPDNLSLTIVKGEAKILTNFKWGATLQKERASESVIQYFASVNF